MARIEDAVILFKTENSNKNSVEELIKKCFIGNGIEASSMSYYIADYHCSLIILDYYDAARDSLEFAIDINQELILDAYGENELTFKLLEILLNNTSGDFMFLDDYEIVFERRNGILFAADSNDHFYSCLFKNCYNLLKSEHLNGIHVDYGIDILWDDGIVRLKERLYDLINIATNNTDVKLIDHSIIKNKFAVSSKYFSITVNAEEKTIDAKYEYVIWIHLSYSDDRNDDNIKYLKKFIRLIIHNLNITTQCKNEIHNSNYKNVIKNCISTEIDKSEEYRKQVL